MITVTGVEMRSLEVTVELLTISVRASTILTRRRLTSPTTRHMRQLTSLLNIMLLTVLRVNSTVAVLIAGALFSRVTLSNMANIMIVALLPNSDLLMTAAPSGPEVPVACSMLSIVTGLAGETSVLNSR